MRIVLAAVCVAAALSPSAAFGDPKTPSQIGEPVPAVNCDIAATEVHTDATWYAIPDCGAPLAMGPIVTPPGVFWGTPIVSVDMDHTWIGDVNLSLQHDTDCDGIAEASATLLCRTGMSDPGCSSSGCCGCSDDIGGVYTFDDAATGAVLGDPFSSCYGGFAAPGCYRPVTPLSAFVSGHTEGCWELVGQDGACGDAFFVNSWTLYLGVIGSPTEPTTWGGVKAIFR